MSKGPSRGGNNKAGSFSKQHSNRNDPIQRPLRSRSTGGSNEAYRTDNSRASVHGHLSMEECDRRPQTQMQTQVQTQRSLEASKQMVYGVFENAISQLEEMEARELGSQSRMQRSSISMPNQSWKKDTDVKRCAETQLLLFETQLNQCPQRVRDEVSDHLTQRTMSWMAARSDKKLPSGPVDAFAAQLVEIIKRGRSTHPADFYKVPDISQKDMKGAMEGLMHGNVKKDELDQKFRSNPNMRSSMASIRSGRNISEGAERVALARPDLRSEMETKTFNTR